jgi:hypothetical protein
VSEPTPGVTRFRPRTEGTFARIERIRKPNADSWRVTGSDGIVSLYGAPLPPTGDPPVIADPAARSRIFAWNLSETSDLFGNRIQYRYRRDADTEGPHTWDQLYLEEIRYVDFETEGQTRFLVSVRFVYEERPDPFSEYRAGFEIRTRLRCSRIEIRTHANPDTAMLVRTYDLVYVDQRVRAGELPGASLPLNRLSLLSQVRMTGHDGPATQALPPLEFGYTVFAPEQQRFQPIRAVNDAMPTRSLADDDHETVALFANGMPDIIQMTGNAARFWRNLGGGLFDAARPLTEVPAGVRLRDAGSWPT